MQNKKVNEFTLISVPKEAIAITAPSMKPNATGTAKNARAMPNKSNTNIGLTAHFWLIRRYAHGLYSQVLSRSRALS